jgi:hypothetical protein
MNSNDKSQYFSLGIKSEFKSSTRAPFDNQAESIPGAKDVVKGTAKTMQGIGQAIAAELLADFGLAGPAIVTGLKGTVNIATGGMTVGVGVTKMFQAATEADGKSEEQTSSFHLIDPSDLSFDGSRADKDSKGNFHLLDSEKFNLNNEVGQSLKELSDSFNETRGSNLGSLSEGQDRHHNHSDNQLSEGRSDGPSGNETRGSNLGSLSE